MNPTTTPRKVIPSHLQDSRPQTPTSSVRKPNVTASPQAPPEDQVYPDEQPGTEEIDDGLTEVERRWNLQPQARVIAKAKKTGRLTLSSRELTSIPNDVWSLLPRSSLYHPSHATSPASRRAAVDLTIAGTATDTDDHPEGLWYEEVDLKVLALANNDITHVDDAMGDFDVLDSLDLHNNQLPSLPLSFCGLACLTTLNLSNNPLGPSLPLVLLSLPALRDLNLASCQLRTLWSQDWKADLDDAVRPTGQSPSATPQSPDTSVDFADMFPSSPKKGGAQFATAQAGVGAGRGGTQAPWARLRTLGLGDNALEWGALRGVEWPAGLVTLDLSGCELRDEAVDPQRMGRLAQLEVLDLARNHLTNSLFVHPALDEDQVEEPLSERAFKSLRSLELELNEIDSFAGVEGWLHRRAGRPLEWQGVEAKVSNLITAAKRLPNAPMLEGVPLAVKVEGNPMRDEQLRRREMFAPRSETVAPAERPRSPLTCASPEAASPNGGRSELAESVVTPAKKARVKEAWEVEAEAGLQTEGGRRKPRIVAAREAEVARRREEQEEKEMSDGRAEEALSNGVAKLVFSAPQPVLVPEAAPPAYSPRQSVAAVSAPPPPEKQTVAVAEPAAPSALPPLQALSPAAPSSAIDMAALRSDAAVKLFQSGVQSRSSSVVLSGKGLASLPTPPSPPPASVLAPPEVVVLQQNVLTIAPLAALAVGWGWAHSLRKLDLTGNRIAELDDLVNGGAVLAGLAELNLSQNRLVGDGRAVFERVAGWCPGLELLDLSRNALTGIEGVEQVLLPREGDGRKGLRRLLLRNNKVATLAPLAAVAERLHARAPGDVGGWRCEAVDVQENEVGRLEPSLGWLVEGDGIGRKVVLMCGGNRFRVPRREVVDAGGGRGVLEWLGERV